MHSRKARPKARIEYTKRKCAQLGASSLTCCSIQKFWSYFARTACSVDATFFNAVGGGEFSASLRATCISVHRPITPRKSPILSSLARCNHYTKFYLNPPLPPTILAQNGQTIPCHFGNNKNHPLFTFTFHLHLQKISNSSPHPAMLTSVDIFLHFLTANFAILYLVLDTSERMRHILPVEAPGNE